MNKTIIIFGGDGYIGWPLTMKLALKHPDHKIIIVDNEWRRHEVQRSGYQSLIPIASPAERLEAFAHIHGQQNIVYIKGTIESDLTPELIKTEQPHTIYHLAHQPSGPYSMKGVEEAVFTLTNNEAGNMRLMWAVMQFSPDTHIVKLGSIGQFAHNGIDIPEGYYLPEHNHKIANKKTLFHREADDVYHISKMNDTNYILMACRKWGLRITDVMQSTVFGVLTDEMQGCEALYTRFDYDEMFGTVLNRFITQVVSHHPMTIFGTGHQRTGLMALKDTVNSLAGFTTTPPAKGFHRVINHVSEKNFSINELADTIKGIAIQSGYDAHITKEYNPRVELDAVKAEYAIATHFLDATLNKTCFTQVVEDTFRMVAQYKSRINPHEFHPDIFWDPQQRHQHAKQHTAILQPNTDITNTQELYWDAFRQQHFPAVRINLNPGTLGTTSTPVIHVRSTAWQQSELHAYPLGTYMEYSTQIEEITSLCREIWDARSYEVCITHSITQELSLLSLSILRKLQGSAQAPFSVITSIHEHSGGIGCFEQLPEYAVHYMADVELNDRQLLTEKIKAVQPHVFFISHVFYDTGNPCPIADVCKTVREFAPKCIIIIDAAQSIGLYPLPASDADIIVSSLHKWLFGPHGGGIVWIKKIFAQWIGGGLYHCGSEQGNVSATRNKGGLDFSYYNAITEALKLYRQTGMNTVYERSCYLASFLREKLTPILEKHNLKYVYLNDTNKSPVVSLGFVEFDPYPLYQYLNKHNIHVKCIKDHKIGDKLYHILRIGLPYYETTDRLQYVLGEIGYFFSDRINSASSAKNVEMKCEMMP